MDNHFNIQKAGVELATTSHLERSTPEIEQPTHPIPMESETLKLNSLFYHQEAIKTPEEERAECRFIHKIDLRLLPLIGILYFLASLVSFNSSCQ